MNLSTFNIKNILGDESDLKYYEQLGHAIEHAESPQRHDIFLPYFQLSDQIAVLLDTEQSWSLYLAQLALLLRSIKNELIPNHWRRACYDVLNKPLLSLQRLATTTEKKHQLNTYYMQINKQVTEVFNLYPF
ncbi:hypothetical protein HWV00_12870 [Moritella sp. 24]|uniref:hypothetical protein n=1 Tax=Moritella sp. 24 TaxID=2746230 RepID=UPI001BA732B0|nr:hypothetical protein [Moritella sp. 24]QUM77060.1 hypothetical protein HWV00_12870 [Moritella sp. 24]